MAVPAPKGGGQPYVDVGKTVDQIPVSISYRIIELFSRGLYKSPNKAIEELVSNSYDARAGSVWVFVAPNPDSPTASIWVVDDGESMDLAGLFDLWQIARSPKEASRDLPSDRPPIGKFGIGKLATYILANKLTYICRRKKRTLAVTMDFGQVTRNPDRETRLKLAVRELNRGELTAALAPLRTLPGGSKTADALLSDTMPTWTVVAMSDLKPSATQLQLGRLRWILSTALPMSPKFTLYLNGEKVQSVVEKIKVLKRWSIGAETADLPKTTTARRDASGHYVSIEGLAGRVHGTVEVYTDVLTKGKASEWGRSHGFFVKVRGRLVNIDDPLFGLPALSHSTFNRFRMVVNADGLDTFLASGREEVQENPAVENFQAYLRAEFNRARALYDDATQKAEAEGLISARIGRAAPSLSRGPLLRAVQRLVRGEVPSMLLIERPDAVSDTQSFLQDLEARAADDGPGLIDDVRPKALGPDRFLASYDPVTRTVYVNLLHPFYANFIEEVGHAGPFNMLAVAEVLTEAYLYDEGLSQAAVERVIQRRDAFLRELVTQNRMGPAVLAQNLRDQKASDDGLEEALAEALGSFGFSVTPIGGNNQPDGIAKAVLGVPGASESGRADYDFTFDAKSTGNTSVATKTIGVSTLARHRDDYKAKYALVVAPDFEGAGGRDSALGKECVKNDVTPIRVEDLALLVEVASARMIGFRKLEELLTTSRTPDESRDWVRRLMAETTAAPPLREVLDVIVELQNRNDPVRISTIAYALEQRFQIVLGEMQVRELVIGLRTLAAGYITLTGDAVTLETSAEKVRSLLASHYRDLPTSVKYEYLEKFLAEPPDRPKGRGRRA